MGSIGYMMMNVKLDFIELLNKCQLKNYLVSSKAYFLFLIQDITVSEISNFLSNSLKLKSKEQTILLSLKSLKSYSLWHGVAVLIWRAVFKYILYMMEWNVKRRYYKLSLPTFTANILSLGIKALQLSLQTL